MGLRITMAEGNNTAELENYNIELMKCIEDLNAKKANIKQQMDAEKQLKSQYEDELRNNTEKLSRINDSLGRKVSARNEYDTTIQETEAAYLKNPRKLPDTRPRDEASGRT